MSGKKDKLKGKANETAGAARKKVGEVTGNEELRSKGATQQAKGKVQGVTGAVKDKLS